jgi:nucleoside-diphosphate-sugar epimerase
MLVLVTGATGFLGRRVVANLTARGHRVRALGRNRNRLSEMPPGVQAIAADLADGAALHRACEGCDAVVHSAALSAPWGKRADFYAVNVQGTQNLLHACQAQGVRRLVHISSPSVVFAGRDLHQATESLPYPRRHLCDYSWSKRLAEQCVHASDRDWITLRPKALFGPGDPSLLPRIVQAARAGRLPIIGSGTNRVDLTYVDNAADAVALAVESNRCQRVYTITNNEHINLWSLISDVLTHLGVDPPRRRLPLGLALLVGRLSELRARLLGGEPTLTRYTAALLGTEQTYDISAARHELGYSPRITVADGVLQTLNAWKEADPC